MTATADAAQYTLAGRTLLLRPLSSVDPKALIPAVECLAHEGDSILVRELGGVPYRVDLATTEIIIELAGGHAIPASSD